MQLMKAMYLSIQDSQQAPPPEEEPSRSTSPSQSALSERTAAYNSAAQQSAWEYSTTESPESGSSNGEGSSARGMGGSRPGGDAGAAETGPAPTLSWAPATVMGVAGCRPLWGAASGAGNGSGSAQLLESGSSSAIGSSPSSDQSASGDLLRGRAAAGEPGQQAAKGPAAAGVPPGPRDFFVGMVHVEYSHAPPALPAGLGARGWQARVQGAARSGAGAQEVAQACAGGADGGGVTGGGACNEKGSSGKSRAQDSNKHGAHATNEVSAKDIAGLCEAGKNQSQEPDLPADLSKEKAAGTATRAAAVAGDVPGAATDASCDRPGAAAASEHANSADAPTQQPLPRFEPDEAVLLEHPDGSRVYVLLLDVRPPPNQAADEQQGREATPPPADPHDAALTAAIARDDAAVRAVYERRLARRDSRVAAAAGGPAACASACAPVTTYLSWWLYVRLVGLRALRP